MQNKLIEIKGLKKSYVTMNNEDMEAEGISSWRIKLASILRDLGVRYTSTVFVIIYGLYITTWLAIEVEIYKNSTTVMILEIIELTWISLFLIEIMIFLASYGPKLY